MSNLILIKEPLDYLKYELLIESTLDLIFRKFKKVKDRDFVDIDSYQNAKIETEQQLYVLIVPRISQLNELGNILFHFYGLTRRLISKKQKQYFNNFTHPVNTQVLLNIDDINLILHNQYVYEFDLIIGEDDNLLINYNRPVIYKKFELSQASNDHPSNPKIYEDSHNFEPDHFKIGCVGGTFDHLHDGHKILLTTGVFLSKEKLVVGLTIEPLLVKKQYREFLQSYQARLKVIRKFVLLLKPQTLKLEVYELKDLYGPTAFVKDLDMLLVTQETASGGKAVNDKRQELNLSQLKVFIVELLDSDTTDSKISSTDIRKAQSQEYEKLKAK